MKTNCTFRHLSEFFLLQAIRYLADAIFAAIGESFTNSERIMHWLIDCTRLTCKMLNRSVFWVNTLS